jgi:myo-inositol-1(or 4)-monophosphatase
VSEELAGIALDVARAAAELVRGRAARGVAVADTKTSDTDVVTEADRASETLIRRLLRERRPDDAFLGEEGTEEAGTSGVRWIIDPIDGTVNFLYGLPAYAVSIAAERDGVVVAGVVLNAVTGTEFVAHLAAGGAEEGGTATRNGIPIGVRGPAPLSHRLVATGFSYDPRVREIQARAMVHFLPRVRDIRRIGSSALDLCHVGEGAVDAYVEEGVNYWDHAAGGLVARIAGARTELTRGAGGRDLMICAPAHGFDEFRAAVRDAGFLMEPGSVSGE